MRLSYSVRNLRRLSSTPLIEIRPITILLGRNSVGKSTFLRSFPLLRQSVETNSNAPILWNGNLVDFGDFKSAVRNGEIDNEIEFSFALSDLATQIVSNKPRAVVNRYAPVKMRERVDEDNLQVSYFLRSRAETYDLDHEFSETELSKIRLELPSKAPPMTIRFTFSSSGLQRVESIFLGDYEITDIIQKYLIYFSTDNLFTAPLVVPSTTSDNSDRVIRSSIEQCIHDIVEIWVAKRVTGRIRKPKRHSETRRILNKKFLDESALEELADCDTVEFNKLYQELGTPEEEKNLNYLNVLCRCKYYFKLLEAARIELSKYFGSVEYIGPARARSERYYRRQELEVSEIASDGKNLPIFLASLEFGGRAII